MASRNKKQTYVYVRTDSIAYDSSNATNNSLLTSCNWIPAIQLASDSNQATVSIPLLSSINEQYDLIGCGTTTNSKSKKIVKFASNHYTIPLNEYDNHVLPMQNVDANGNLEDYKDMVELPFMNEAAILYNLKLRHMIQKPYTRTGDIIFAINPYQWYNNLYTTEKRIYYANRLIWEVSEEDPRSIMEPHVYEVSALSYKGLLNNNTNKYSNQSILVSGESGAGKTETVKICLNHIANVQRGHEGHVSDHDILDPVVKRVVESNPLLEAFGNAKTRRNDNSSRFGKYIQLQFSNNSSCQLVGSVCDVYLLEKNRIIVHEPNKERNFHIFYQLLSSELRTTFWKGFSASNINHESFKYIGTTITHVIEGIHDRDRFQLTIDALKLVNVIDDKLYHLMQSMCIVLVLGNMIFQPSKHDNHDEAIVQSLNELQSLSELLGISITELEQCFISRTFKTQKEEHKVPLNVNQAKEACDAFAKEAYERSFLWLVNSINDATTATSSSATTKQEFRTIGLLDIFGFESFPYNGFEQLCINYANEKLQQKFNQDIFANVKEEYEYEGISLDDIYYDDNTDVLDLIEGKIGLLALLNEECVRPKGNDFDFVQKALQMNTKSKCLHINKTDRLSFAIHHYAGIVMYNATTFVIKNLDTLPTDLEVCMNHSHNIVIKAKKVITPHMNVTDSSTSTTTLGGGQQRAKSNITAPTIWTKYKTQLTTLMKHLNLTQSRYVRCIKPNNMKKPLIMEHEPILDQLRCAGVVAAITISRSCFPNRLPNSVVLARYSYQLDHNSNSNRSRRISSSTDSLEQKRATDCNDLMDILLKSKEVTTNGKVVKAYVVGKTKTYYRSGALEFLESNRSRGQDLFAMTIQRIARKWLKRNKNKHNKDRRRQEEMERLAREKAAADKRASIEKEFNNLRSAHTNKQNELQNKINQLQQLMKGNDNDTTVTISTIEQQCKLLEGTITEMEGKHKHDMEAEINRRKIEKAQQEKKLEQANNTISLLKKENTKLRTKQEKKMDKLRDVDGTTQKITDMHNSLSNMNMNMDNETYGSEIKNLTLKEQHDTLHKNNQNMIKEINDITSSYTVIAHSRREYQKVMVQMLNMVHDQIKKNRPLQEEIVKIAFAAENNGKIETEKLKIETEGVSLDHYSTH